MNLNPKRISIARNIRGISQGELSKILALTNQAVLSNIETGKLPFEEDFAIKLSDKLKFPISFFSKNTSFTRLSKFYYRKRNAFPASELVPLESKIEAIRSGYAELIKSVDVNIQKLPQIPVTEKNRPEEIAKLFRLFIGLNDDPIDNLVSIIEKLGIAILFIDVSSDKFSGLTVQTDNNLSLIIVNKNMPNDHKKFTIAHEVGHIIMHIPFAEDPDFISNLEDLDVVERQADAFAGAFLIPKEQAKYTFRQLTYTQLGNLKTYWKVSKQAILFRAKALGILTDVRFKTLYIELSRNGERKKEKIEIWLDQPTMIKKLIEFYESEFHYSRKQIAEEIIGIDEKEFVEWFDIYRPQFRVISN